MGLRLPIYPYYVGKGKADASKDEGSHYNKLAYAPLERFQTYLSRADVKSIAENIIFGSIKKNDSWFCTRTFDLDRYEHPELSRLLIEVGKHGTILIPDLTEITGTKEKRTPRWKLEELVEQIYGDNIEVLPLIFKIKGQQSYDLTKIVDSGRPDPTIFEVMPQIAMKTTEYLKRFAGGQKGKRRTGSSAKHEAPLRKRISLS